jgi:Spy/CpxP family protein refolding chaperone
MRTILKLAAAFGLAACLTTSTANAQGGRGGMGMGGGTGLNLLSNKSVQKELKLTDDQIEKANKAATEAREKMMEKFQELRDLDQAERQEKMQGLMKEMATASKKVTDELLKPEQAKRLGQITLQTQGVMAYMSDEVQSKLKFTDEQKTKFKDIQASSMEQMTANRELMQSDREAGTKKMTEIRKETSEKAAAVLTSEQKATWKEMTGEPFTLVQEPQRRPGGN